MDLEIDKNTSKELQMNDKKDNNNKQIENSKMNGDEDYNNKQIENSKIKKEGWLEIKIGKLNESTENFKKSHNETINIVKLFVLNGVIFGYFFAALYYFLRIDSNPFDYCNGFGSLAVFLSIVYIFLFYFYVVKKYFNRHLNIHVWKPTKRIWSYFWRKRIFRFIFSFVLIFGAGVFLFVDTRGSEERLVSLLGLGVFILLGTMFSNTPKSINWKTVISGLVLQVLFGLLTIRWKFGRDMLQCFANKVATFLSYGLEGSSFVFSEYLVKEQQVFAFSSLTIIFFFSTVVEVLFFWGALQWFCLKIGSILQSASGVTICEGTIAVGNIFLGMTESALIIKEYLHILTPSELHFVMSSGFATVSGTILAAYISFGADPGHLITASVMSAPAAIMYAKLLYPETQESRTSKDKIELVKSQETSAISAATKGATNGIHLVLNIIANLIAFVSLIAFCNGLLGYLGGMFDFHGLNLEWIFGKIFIPLSWIMGVPWAECETVGILIGLKTVVNEFVAYQKMGEFKEAGMLSPRAEIIATYALCGFTNPSSGGIMIGAMSALAPNQRPVLAKVVIRAFFAGCAICFMTACIAGILLPEDGFGETATNSILTTQNSTLF